jgi:hypothetical protein
VQRSNVVIPIDVTLLGILTDAREVQAENAEVPSDVTLLGILTDIRELY